MKNRSISLLAVLLFAAANACAQHVFFQDKKGVITDSSTYVVRKSEQIEQVQAAFPNKRVRLKETRTEIRRSQDSIVFFYEWDIVVEDAKRRKRAENVFAAEDYLHKKFPLPQLTGMDGQLIKPDELRGKPVLLNFWFTTCAPCIEEMPVLNNIKQELEGKVHFIAITFESKEKVKRFLTRYKFDFIQVVDAKRFINSIHLQAFPVNIFLDKDGIAQKIEFGIPYVKGEDGKLKMGDGREFAEALRALL